MSFEFLTVDRAGAAAAVGVTEAQIANWVTKYGLFPQKRQGKGTHFAFNIRDAVALAVIKELTTAGLAAPEAVAAVTPHSPYGAMLHDPAGTVSNYPGTFFLARGDDGQWVGFDGPHVKISVQVRVWPVFDAIFPNFVEQLRAQRGALTAEQFDGIVSEYTAVMQRLRAERWGNQ